ncbi:MAG: hypothetical protein O8C61_00140 [Candidatus Methanoperedens sp.]|nr:hypothetical protein [Candidatus Methanoperedens sp.]
MEITWKTNPRVSAQSAFHPLLADPTRTQTGASTALQNTAGALAAGFQGRPRLLHGA